MGLHIISRVHICIQSGEENIGKIWTEQNIDSTPMGGNILKRQNYAHNRKRKSILTL